MPSATALEVPPAPLTRIPTSVLGPPAKAPSFVLDAANRSYRHQYANIYFVRLAALRKSVEQNAKRRWSEVAGQPDFVPRVLDIVKGQLCYIVGTVYMDMPLKPNVLQDIANDHGIPAPPPRQKYHSSEDSVMLEDESGRVHLIGERVRKARLVTGVILAALGIETNNGDFEVVDICFAGMAPQPSAVKDEDTSMEVDDAASGEASSSSSDEWIALVSGLEVGAHSPVDAQLQMLVEYLTGEVGGLQDQTGAARVSRLIIAGNSLASAVSANGGVHEDTEKKPRKYGYDNATFTPHPTLNLSAHLLDLARSMPVHLLPGPSDPTGITLPQQPIPRAMFRGASSFSTFTCETNPAYIRIGGSTNTPDHAATSAAKTSKGKEASTSASPSSPHPTPSRTLLVHSGQPLDDIFRYLPTPPCTRLSIAESTLRWRHLAPTAPDTLWCHPYFTTDPFVISETPDLYVLGNQPAFRTKIVTDRSEHGDGEEEAKTRCRIVLVPGFKETGVLVLVNLRTLGVRIVNFAVEGMSGGGGT